MVLKNLKNSSRIIVNIVCINELLCTSILVYPSVSQPFVERGTLDHLYLFLRNPLALKFEIFNFSSKYQHYATFIASKYNIPPPMRVLPHFKNLLDFGEIGYKKREFEITIPNIFIFMNNIIIKFFW